MLLLPCLSSTLMDFVFLPCFSSLFNPYISFSVLCKREHLVYNILETAPEVCAWTLSEMDLGDFCLICFSISKRLSSCFSLSIFFLFICLMVIYLFIYMPICVCIRQRRNLNIQNSDIQKYRNFAQECSSYRPKSLGHKY